MTKEEMQRQIESMMPTPKQIAENIDKKLKEEKDLFEKLYNNAIKDKGYQFLSDKSTAFYWFKKGKEL